MLKDAGEVKILDEGKINPPEISKSGEVLYTVNNDFTELKNPFSFEHETESEETQMKNEAAENKPKQNTVQDSKANTEKIFPVKNPADIKKENKDTGSVKAAGKYKAEAVFDINGQKSALIKAGNKEVRVQEGDMIKNVKVTGITKNGVILQTAGGRSVDCPLNDFSAEEQK